MRHLQCLERIGLFSQKLFVKSGSVIGFRVSEDTTLELTPRSALFFQEQNRKPFIGIGEVFHWAEAKETELFLQATWIEFSTDLHEDFFVFQPAK